MNGNIIANTGEPVSTRAAQQLYLTLRHVPARSI